MNIKCPKCGRFGLEIVGIIRNGFGEIVGINGKCLKCGKLEVGNYIEWDYIEDHKIQIGNEIYTFK